MVLSPSTPEVRKSRVTMGLSPPTVTPPQPVSSCLGILSSAGFQVLVFHSPHHFTRVRWRLTLQFSLYLMEKTDEIG